VVKEEDEDCPLSWENDDSLKQLVEQKRKDPDGWTWFVDNCLKQVNITTYNNFVKTGIMKPSEAFTKSDEGLAITLLVNGYPRWRVQVCGYMNALYCYSADNTLICESLLVPAVACLLPHFR